MTRLFSYVIPFAAILILLAPPLYADPIGPVLIDFEDVDPELVFSLESSFTSSIANITIEQQVEFPDDDDIDEYVHMSTDAIAGGTGTEIGEIRNLNLHFDLGSTVDSVEFKYYDAGGNLNLEINGQMLNFYRFENIDEFSLGGTVVSVELNDPNQGQVEITGKIYSFKIGGTSLWIDDMTVSGFSNATFHVDEQGSDDNIGLSSNTAFATIQKAINVARDGDTVLVHPGIYRESINFSSKSIVVMGVEEPPVIQSPDEKAAVAFSTGENKNAVFKNFIITKSNFAISCLAGSPVIQHITVTDNESGITVFEGSAPFISNCIVWGNKYADISVLGDPFDIQYSCTEILADGIGNIAADPMFVRRGYWQDNSTPNDPNDDVYVDGDYHLKSEGWRWSEVLVHGSHWYFDDFVTSRCIDAGNPSDVLGNEPVSVDIDTQNQWSVNKRVNMGAYGSTQWASMPPYGHALIPDINNDGIVNGNDLIYLAEYWLEIPSQIADVCRDGLINMKDYSIFSKDWLKITSWGNDLNLKDYWPFTVSADWSSPPSEPNSFSYEIVDTFDNNGVKIWQFSNYYQTPDGPVTEDEYCFYFNGDLYSTKDSNDLENIPSDPQLLQKRFPGVIVPEIPIEIPGLGVLYPVRGSLSSVLKNSDYSIEDFPMGDNNDVIAFIDNYGLPNERIKIILARGFGPLLIGSDYTDELIVVKPRH